MENFDSHSSLLLPKLPKLRVLVVDDNTDAADSMAMVIEMLGHEVLTVGEGKKALVAAVAFKPDLALIDISLPDISGHEVARQLRALPVATISARARLHLIAVTGWSSDEDRRRSLEAGFDQHLSKPLDLDRLESMMAGLAAFHHSPKTSNFPESNADLSTIVNPVQAHQS